MQSDDFTKAGLPDTGTDAPPADSISVQVKSVLNAEGDGMKLEDSGEISIGDQFSAAAKSYTKYGYDGSVALGAEQAVTVKDPLGATTVKAEVELSAGKELELKEKGTLTRQEGLVEQEMSMERGLGFDGEKLSYGVGAEASEKIGTDEAYTKTAAGSGMKMGSDGSVEMENSQSVETKAGPVETSAKHTGTTGAGTEKMSNGETGESVSHTEKIEIGAKAEVADGVKVSHSESVEIGVESAESKNISSEEVSIGVSSQTRIEVDSEKAGIGAAAAAGVFNTTMAAKEAVVNELMNFSVKTETKKVEEEAEEEKPQEPKEEEKEKKTEEEVDAEENEEEEADQEEQEKEAAEKEETEEYDYYNGIGY